jgi:hypothetical protein
MRVQGVGMCHVGMCHSTNETCMCGVIALTKPEYVWYLGLLLLLSCASRGTKIYICGFQAYYWCSSACDIQAYYCALLTI